MKKPKCFNCYLDNEVLLNHLSDEQAGKLWKSLFTYANRDKKSTIADPVVALAYEVMAQQIKRDFAKYNEKCEKNRKNRASSDDCEQKSTNVNERQRTLTTVNEGNQEEEKEEDKKENKDKEKHEEDKEDKDNIEDKKDKADENDCIKQAVECDSTISRSFISEVIDYLNHKIGTRYRTNSKSTVRLITARVKEGFTLSDFKKVIDSRIDAWGKDKQMQQYLRPETLFSNKFESYLNFDSIRGRNYTQVFDYDEEF